MGVAQDFSAFVQRQQRKVAEEQAIDWNKQKQEWLYYLDKLYTDIETYLSDYIKAGSITLKWSQIELNEENIGTYDALRLFIEIGPQQISLTPVGTVLIGTKGRVDVEGSSGRSRLVLVDKFSAAPRAGTRIRAQQSEASQNIMATYTSEVASDRQIDWVWKIVTRPPTIVFIDLTKESLFEMLMEISNG